MANVLLVTSDLACSSQVSGAAMRVGVTLETVMHAARLTVYIDGDNRTPYDASRGQAGRADWTAAVNARTGTILTDNFNGVNIDVPEGKTTSVGNFSIFFTQTGGISKDAGNTAKLKHPTGIFVGTTGTGSTAGKNDEQIEGIELRYEIGDQKTTALEFRFNPPIFAFAAMTASRREQSPG